MGDIIINLTLDYCKRKSDIRLNIDVYCRIWYDRKRGGGMQKSQQELTEYKRKFNEENYDRIGIYLRSGEKEQWQAAAEKSGQSLNKFIRTCVNECLKKGGF